MSYQLVIHTSINLDKLMFNWRFLKEFLVIFLFRIQFPLRFARLFQIWSEPRYANRTPERNITVVGPEHKIISI